MLFRERKTYANLVIGAPRTSHCAINTDCRSRQCFLRGTLQIHKYTCTEFDRERGKLLLCRLRYQMKYCSVQFKSSHELSRTRRSD